MTTVVLLTVPHSGTHTWMEAMFQAGIKDVWWGHLDPNNRGPLEKLLALPKEEYVLCLTQRDYRTHKDSIERRAAKRGLTDVDAMAWFESCLDVRDWFVEETLDRRIVTLATDGPYTQRRGAMQYVMARCGLEYVENSDLDHFMTTWPRFNKFHPDPTKRMLGTTHPLIDYRLDRMMEIKNAPAR